MRFFAISFALVMITFLQPAGMYPSIQSLCYSMMEFPDLNGIVEPREYEIGLFTTPLLMTYSRVVSLQTLPGGVQ
jgi:hypothetical protein